MLFSNFEILNLFLHLNQHIFLFFFLLYLFLFAINLDITPDFRAEFALHPMSKLIKSNIFFGDLGSDELNSDVDSLSDLDSVTY